MLRRSLESLLDLSVTTITPQGQLCVTHSPSSTYTITNVQTWTHVELLNRFWREHEQLFITYLTFCYAHPSPITLVSMYLCGLDLHSLSMARTTYQAIVPNYSFLSIWIRQIISFGHLAQCQCTQDQQSIQIKNRRLYITSLMYPVTYYYPLNDQPHTLNHCTPFHIEVDKLQKAWAIHYELAPTLRKITHKKHINTRKPMNDSLASPAIPFQKNCLFGNLWPHHLLPLRQSFPKEFDGPTSWCIDTERVVVRLQSLTFNTLLYISHIDPSALCHAMTLHQALTALWRQYEYLIVQELESCKQRYMSPQFLSQWCQATFGMSLMSTLECVDPIRSQIDLRFHSLFNSCLGALQSIPQPNVSWCKKTVILTVFNWSIRVCPMPPWSEWESLPCLKTLTSDELHYLYHELSRMTIEE